MKYLLRFLVLTLLASAASAAPLRVFIRAGESNRGREVHAHPRFLEEWKPLLTERGAVVDGALGWPTAEQLAKTDVLVLYAQDGGNATEQDKKNVADFTKRGGGLVVIHTAAVSDDPPWWKSVIGGAWVPKQTKWKEGPMDLYYVENQKLGGGHPITIGASNFQLDDEIYYDMDIAPEAHVLATSYTPNVKDGKKPAEGGKAHIYDIQPQMWAYEKDGYRSFVSLPGHQWKTFTLPQYRAVLLRGIAWAGKRTNLDELCKKDELDALTYPPGGPQRPADTLKALEIHPDFTLKLVASEPLINKPMNFDWDPAGRLWVAETPEYPNGRRGMRPDYRGKEWKDHGGIDPAPGEQERKGQDKISILTDTDGDGVMDKKHVFYEGLDLVTGLVFHKDGVIVTQAPDILWLRDTNADGTADKVETLYGGLGTGDTHAVINNPRWGWDGWIYATHGYSGSSKVKNAKGETQGNIGSGVVRFRPDGSKIEQYSSKGGNTWGLTITGDNRVMWTQPTSGTLLNQVVLPEYALARGKVGNTPSFHTIIAAQKSYPAMSWEQLAYVQIDRVGDFTAGAGSVIYDGGSWPAEYNGDYFTTECTINVVAHQRLTPKGSSYVAAKLPGREETEFIRSKDMWWRPIEVRVGPDGAVYIGDFYNQAVIHNDTRGPDHNRVNAAVRPDRDHYFGRIWRVDHKAAKKVEAPVLVRASTKELMKALEHPNRHVRMNASRLLRTEIAQLLSAVHTDGSAKPAFDLVKDVTELISSGRADTVIAALWTAGDLAMEVSAFTKDDALRKDVLATSGHKDPNVRRNFALLMEASGKQALPQLTTLLQDSDATVRLAALRAIATAELSDEAAKALIAAFPKLDDDFQRSAAVGAASRNPSAVISAALDSADAPMLAPLVGALTQGLTNADDAAKLVTALAGKPANADALKRSILDSLAKNVKDAPAMTPELSAALAKLLGSGASGSVLPLAAKWDKAGALKGEIVKQTSAMIAKLNDTKAGDDARFAAATSLLGLSSANTNAYHAVADLLGTNASPTLQKWIVTAVGQTDQPDVGTKLVAVFGKLPPEAQPDAFDALLKRSAWTGALLDGVKAKSISLANLGPANIARLRTHPDPAISKRAADMLEELNPMAKLKNEAIAKLAPIVEGPGGDPAKGKAMFTTSCAICHVFDGQGKDIGPGLTGMGSHGPGELLTAIVDPNREVEPSFAAWNFETKSGQFASGIIARENPASVIIRSLAGEQEVKVSDIKTRTNTGRSLMPEGFEALGAEAIRDVIAYMAQVDGGGFRTLDLSTAFTASSARGFYADERGRSLELVKTGTVKLGSVPFNIVAPEKSPTGKNVVNLKGGPQGSMAKTQMPQRVEIKAGGFKANRLHFLGGIGGWAYPFIEDKKPVVTCTVNYADGDSEKLVFNNGVEFADHIARRDVPGSEFAEGLARGHQIRWFSKQLKKAAPIANLVLESPDNDIAPTLLAITAQLADANAAPLVAPKPAATAGAGDDAGFKPQFSDAVPQPPASAKGPRVLLVGGGSSHDFVKFFGEADKAILAPHVGWVDFTQNANGVAEILDRVDVLVWSANQPISAATRKALMDYVNAGKAVVAYHPGTWYAWNNFPLWNKEVVGGGARGHDKFGEFEVRVENRAHPITAGLPESFKITDELYYYLPATDATPIEVLATAVSTQKPGTYPQVFVVKHPKARIVGLTLGHDAKAHDLPEFQKLLRQAVLWAAGKTALAAK